MNVVFILLDDTAYDAFAKMPYLASSPDSRWTRFTKCYFNNPYCGPSRCSIYTGRTCSSHGGIDHGSPTVSTMRTFYNTYGDTMLPLLLKERGYRTFHGGKWLNQAPWDKGDTWIPDGYDAYLPQLDDAALGGTHNTGTFIHSPAFVNYALNVNGTVDNVGTTDPWTTTGADDSGRSGEFGSVPRYFTDRLNVQARNFIDDHAGKQMFLWLSERATHGSRLEGGGTGIQAAARHLSPFAVDAPDIASRPGFNPADTAPGWATKPAWVRAKPRLTATEITEEETDQTDQWRSVHSVDETLRDLFTRTKAKSVFDNTVWIITSDNGWLRGEHRLRKKNVCYEPSVRTELWIRHPSAPLANRTSTALIQNIDIFPTICEITGAKAKRAINGQSFLPLVLGTAADSTWRSTAFIESYDVDGRGTPSFKGVITATHKYVELEAFNDGVTTHPAEAELYDLAADPNEVTNVVNDGSYASVKATLQASLDRLKTAAAA